jgi:hypothetical protein
MFAVMYKKPLFPINQKLSDYCKKSTNESIRKITERYNEERKTVKINLDCLKVTTNDDLPNPNNNDFIFSIICLLSSTTMLYYFYKTLR